jgi:spore germination protein (amino acid permease)
MDKISPKHFIFFILGTTVVSLKTYPTTFMRDGQRDSWIAIIIASVIIFVFFIYIINIWKQNNTYDLVKIYQTALGKFLGNIFIYLFLATLFITLVECTSLEADSMHQNILIRTPHWYLLLFFIVPSLYTVRKDLVAIVIVTIIGITLVMISGINLGILTLPNKKISLLFPVFEYGITKGFIKCILKMIGLYGCISITLPYLSKIKDEKKKMIKNVIIGLLILIQMHIFSIAGLIMTFGPDWVNTMNYPKLIQTQLISFFQFLDFGELYVMLQVIGGWLLKYMITFYALLIVLRNLNIKRNHVIMLTYSISAFVFVASYIATNNLFLLFKLLNYYEYICLVNFVIIPFIVFSIFNERIKYLRE